MYKQTKYPVVTIFLFFVAFSCIWVPYAHSVTASPVAIAGFGDPHNSYSWSMAWFKNKLYVGTGRDILALKAFEDVPFPMKPWPVTIPPTIYVPDMDLRAQIWCYTPERGTWEMVYQSPLIIVSTPSGDRQIARDTGYRSMRVFTEKDGSESLYIATGMAAGVGAYILRTTDGRNFETVSVPGLIPGLPEGSITSIRALIVFNGKLYTTPAGSKGSGNMTEVRTIYESEDPAHGVWIPVSEPSFGDDTNLSVFDMGVFNGYLYAGTLNPTSGCQIWKTDGIGEPPYHWTLVLRDGAGRGPENELTHSLKAFNGYLYVGTSIQNGGHDFTYNIGFAAGEMLRVAPNDSWELVCGFERDTPQGHKKPITGLTAGFLNAFSGYMWRMEVHDGWLYFGTFDASEMIPYVPIDALSNPQIRRFILALGADWFVNNYGGGDLWRTKDGYQWFRITGDGFGNPNNYGFRSMASTPYGIFIGVANPFTDAPYPNGGCQVWLVK